MLSVYPHFSLMNPVSGWVPKTRLITAVPNVTPPKQQVWHRRKIYRSRSAGCGLIKADPSYGKNYGAFRRSRTKRCIHSMKSMIMSSYDKGLF